MVKYPKSGIFTNNFIGWGESGKVILQISITVLSGAVEIFFGQIDKDGSALLEKNGPYAYVHTDYVCTECTKKLPNFEALQLFSSKKMK